MSRTALVLTPWFPNSPGEREGNYIYDSVMAVRERGINVNVLLTRPWKPWKRDYPDISAFPDNLNLELISYLSIPRDFLRGLSNKLLAMKLAPLLYRYAIKHDVQLIHAHTESLATVAADVALQLGIPSVVSIHGINTSRRYLGNRSQKEYFRSSLNRVDRVVLVGEPLRGFFAEITGRDDHFRVVHNGFHLPSLPKRNEPLFSKNKVRMISVSNLHEGKGIDLTIRALNRLKTQTTADWDYRIIGDGYMRPKLEKLVQDLKLEGQITFAGAVPHSEVSTYLAEADIFVLPSYREAFGIAYLEAMACGLLAIGVKGQGPDAFIRHGDTGLLTVPHDIDDLTKCLALAMHQPQQMRTIAEKGRSDALSCFTWQNHGKQLVKIYDELFSEGVN